MHSFVFTLSPLEPAPPTLAVASLRAGSSAWLDAEFLESNAATIEAVRPRLTQLASARSANAWPGLRLSTDQVEDLAPLLLELATGENAGGHWVVLVEGSRPLGEVIDALPQASDRRMLWEISDVDDLTRLDTLTGSPIALHGIVARGDECGGWGRGDSAFILTQKLAAYGIELPFYVRGAIGPGAAAACRVAGASGVVLADELLLMPESSVPESARQLLRSMDGQEAQDFGYGLDEGCRVLFRRDLPGAVRLQEVATSLSQSWASLGSTAARSGLSGTPRASGRDATAKTRRVSQKASEFRRAARDIVRWGPLSETAWPVGQGIALAEAFRNRYRTTGRLLQAINRASISLVKRAAADPALAPGSALAQSHRTRFPIVQGAMTRVSDSPDFAAAVAGDGALPLLALALMSEEETRTLLRETREALGERSWGVGILGFVPPETRDAQVRAIAEIGPSFALIAGGRPDQAAELERHGIPTYLHTPVPGLLRRFLDQGCRRFAFEGRECGGHVGPLFSFPLWQVMVQTLLDHASDQALRETRVLFAGGIHDATSAAMVNAIAAPLVERGVQVGVIVGSAYLFTKEAVETGAISELFQRQAIDCRRTVTMQTGPGHVIRTAPTPFVDEFEAAREHLLASGASGEKMRATLEQMGVGRARIASKGIAREGEQLIRLDTEEQERDGMFMMGSLASMRRSVVPVAALHESLCQEGVDLLVAANRKLEAAEGRDARPARVRPARVAIVGIGCLLPGAQQAERYWRNLLTLPQLVKEVPRHRWDWRVLYSEDPKELDKTYSKWGGFFDEVPFDPVRYGIPPNSMKSLSTQQLLALEVVRWALQDAGYENGDFDRENTSVIIGTGANGDLEQHYTLRTLLPLVVENLTDEDMKRLPVWTEESFAGVLANVTAGRIANRFDLGGANYTVDAACASGLTVVDLALSELSSRRSNVVLACGLDLEQTPHMYQGFSRVQAVSPKGRVRTFDRDADGIVISEGMVVVVLKRLDDAVRDGDRIYGVIQSATGSSDGKALGMTAPRSIGQRRALRRAYEEAGLSPAQIGLYEAHGTGTPVGDKAEAETIRSTLIEAGAGAKSCAIGSVKSLLGHTKSAAGLVGLAKAALALHHRTLPPHANVERPLPELADPASPVYLLREPRPWLAADGELRRAGVSAFGFGGTNFHAVLEEYRDPFRSAPLGGGCWPVELFVFRAGTREELAAEVRRVLAAVSSGRELRQRDLAYTLALRADARRDLPLFLGLVAVEGTELRATLQTVVGRLEGEAQDPVGPLGRVRWQRPESSPVALVFPGQGSQEPDMAREAVLYLRELRESLESADRVTVGCFEQTLSQTVFPPSAFTDEEKQQQRARVDATHIAQPAIGALSLGMLDFARRLGLKPAMAAGHSYGELTALCAADAMSRDDFLRLSEERGRAMAGTQPGAMAAVSLGAAALERLLAELSPDRGAAESNVVVANRNAPDQSVLSGAEEAVDSVIALLEARSMRARRLPVSGAFHSALMQPANARFQEAIGRLDLRSPSIPVYSTARAEPYPSLREDVSSILRAQMMSPVDFNGQIEAMYRAGARVFLETGPGRILTGLIDRILGDRPHSAVALDGGGLKGLLLGLAQIEAAGAGLTFEALFHHRECRAIDLAEAAQAPKQPPMLWYIDGGRVRTPDQQYAGTGKLPLLSYEQIQEAKARKKQVPAVSVGTTSGLIGSNGSPAEYPGAPASLPGRTHRNRDERPRAQPVAQTGAFGNGASAPALQAYEAYQETMRRFLATQEAVMARVLGGTVAHEPELEQVEPGDRLLAHSHVVDEAPQPVREAPRVTPAREQGLHEPVPDETEAEPVVAGGLVVAPVTAPVASLADGPIDRERLVAALTEIVSARTGYPADTLDPSLDLEADLGVDSIKRLEIIDAIGRELPAAYREAVQQNIEQLVREKTLAGWAGGLARLTEPSKTATVQSDRAAGPVSTQSAADKAAPDLTPGGEGHPHTTSGACQRYVVGGRPGARAENGEWVPRGSLLVTEDEFGVARGLIESFAARGIHAELLTRDVLREPGGTERWLERFNINGGIGALIHLAPLANGGVRSIEQFRTRSEIEVKSLFDLLRAMARYGQLDKREGAPFRVLGATLLGGTWGRSPYQPQRGGGAASNGGVYGVLKTLSSEYPHVVAQALDFDHTLDRQTIVTEIVDELRGSGYDFELGYPAGRRTVYRAQLAPLEMGIESPDLLPSDGWVVLITGGARGITAELAQRLAAPGVRFVIVGRSPLPGEPDQQLKELDEPALRAHLLKTRRNRDGTVRPAEIEAMVRTLLKEREVRDNLRRIESAGATVDYIAADVRTELESTIEGIYERFGRLDAVLHGAGIIEDRLLSEKSRDSFERVFDTKADSSFVLSHALRPQSLRWVVLMSSISGRIGNRGQVDYAAANEVMNRMAWQMSRDLAPARVLAINWGPWTGAGMASPGVVRELASRGIPPIDLEAGWQFLRRELVAGSADTVEVIAGAHPDWT